MGATASKEKAIKNIIKNTRNSLTEQDLEEIMMNTQFNEYELYRLHEKFLTLDRQKRGKLTNREFLEIDELKWTPFRTRLLNAFPLKTDDEVRAAQELRAETLKLEDYKDLEEMLKDKDKAGDVKNSKDDMATGMEEARRRANLDEEDEKRDASNKSNLPLEDEKKRDRGNHANMQGDDVNNEIDQESYVRLLGTMAYIDFSEFWKLLAIFNPRFNLDEKVKFYFRIFDFNQDKKITDDDLARIIDLMFGEAEEGSAGFLPDEDKRHLIDKLMQESDTGQKGYLDYDDLEKVLWATNIEQKCSMTFFMS